VRALRSINDPKISGRASIITVKWQAENAEDTLRSATMADGRQGWFEIQMEHYLSRRTARPRDRIVFMDDGVIVEEGPPKQVLDQSMHQRTRRFLRMVAHEETEDIVA
jgi:hypothetical protein